MTLDLGLSPVAVFRILRGREMSTGLESCVFGNFRLPAISGKKIMSFGPKLQVLGAFSETLEKCPFNSVEPSGVNKNLGQQKPRIV